MGKPLKISLYLSVFALTGALAINFCALLFQCGCQAFWMAGAAHCNIHHQTGPHCPWCTHDGAGFVLSMVPVFLTQGWVMFRPGTWSWKRRIFLALAAFPAVGGVLGGITGLTQGYWNL